MNVLRHFSTAREETGDSRIHTGPNQDRTLLLSENVFTSAARIRQQFFFSPSTLRCVLRAARSFKNNFGTADFKRNSKVVFCVSVITSFVAAHSLAGSRWKNARALPKRHLELPAAHRIVTSIERSVRSAALLLPYLTQTRTSPLVAVDPGGKSRERN